MTKEDYMHLPKSRLAELLAERDLTQIPQTLPITFEYPCYAAGGVCTNPLHDCMNCPRHGFSYRLSTTTEAKIDNEK